MIKPNHSMGFGNKRKPEEKNCPQAGNRATKDFQLKLASRHME